MRILIVGLKKNEQAQRVIKEGHKRGHEVTAVLSSDLMIDASPLNFKPSLLNHHLASYDLIYLWAVSKRRWEWFVAAQYLHKYHKTKIINRKILEPDYSYFLTPAADYWKQTDLKLSYPKSTVFFSEKAVDSAIVGFEFPLILKLSPSRKGKGIFKVNSEDEIRKIVSENKDTAFVLREFIPNDGDVRIFTVGYKAIGAMKRTPKTGDFRSNISQGGSGGEFDLNSNTEVAKIAEAMAEVTRTEIAGVDIMIHSETQKPYILEINPGPQFTGFEKYTGINAAEEIIKYFEKVGV